MSRPQPPRDLSRSFGPGLRPSAVRTLEDIEVLERTPFLSRLPAESTIGCIDAAARQFADKVAYKHYATCAPGDQPEAWTYREMSALINRLANLFRELDQKRDEAVLFICPAYAETQFAIIAAQANGASCVANPFLSIEHLVEIATAAKARAIVTSADPATGLTEKAEEIARQVPSASAIYVAGPGESRHPTLVAAASSHAPIRIGADPAGADVAALFHTGGTTGAPKLAKLTHANVLAGAWTNGAAHHLSPDAIMVNGLPLFHVGGGVVICFRTLMLGQTLIQLSPAGFRGPHVLPNFWDLVRRESVTDVIAVPTTFLDLLNHDPPSAAGTLRRLVAGASKLPPALSARYFAQLGLEVHEGYGMTECSGFCAANPTEAPTSPGSGGVRTPYHRVRVAHVDAAGVIARDYPPGESGEIVVSGPGVFAGYARAEAGAEKFARDPEDGSRWLRSGDLGKLDSEGRIWVIGRLKDVIIRGGHNLDATEVDELLLAHPDVTAAATVATPDLRLGELPVAFVTLRPDARVSAADLIAYCAERVSERAATPVEVFVLESVPLTAMGKIYKPELRRQACEIAISRLMKQEFGAKIDTRATSNARGEIAIEISPGETAAASDMERALATLATLSIPVVAKAV